MAPELRDAKNIVDSSSRTNPESVAVVGGSAAGLFTASILARQGISVRVFERIETLEPDERTSDRNGSNARLAWTRRREKRGERNPAL